MSDTVKAAAPSELFDVLDACELDADEKEAIAESPFVTEAGRDVHNSFAVGARYVIGRVRAALSTESPQEATPAPSEPVAWKSGDEEWPAVILELCHMYHLDPSETRWIALGAAIKAAATPAVAPAAAPQEAPSERETIIGSAVGRIRATIPVEGESPEKLIEAIAQRVADMAKETWKPWIGGDPKLASPTEKGKE